MSIENISTIAGTVFIGVGLVFMFAMTVGMLRFPDSYTRLHAGTKGLTVGAGFILLGVALRAPSISFALRAVLVLIFFLVTNPIAIHAIARANYRAERVRKHLLVDEYAERLEKPDDT